MEKMVRNSDETRNQIIYQDLYSERGSNIKGFLKAKTSLKDNQIERLFEYLMQGYMTLEEKERSVKILEKIKEIDPQILNNTLLSASKNITPLSTSDTQNINTSEIDKKLDYYNRVRGQNDEIHKILSHENITHTKGFKFPLLHIRDEIKNILHQKITPQTINDIDHRNWVQSRFRCFMEQYGIKDHTICDMGHMQIWNNSLLGFIKTTKDGMTNVTKMWFFDGKMFYPSIQNQNKENQRIDDIKGDMQITKNQQYYIGKIIADNEDKLLIGLIGYHPIIFDAISIKNGRQKKITQVKAIRARKGSIGTVVHIEGMNHPQLIINGRHKNLPRAKNIKLTEVGYAIQTHDNRLESYKMPEHE